MRFTTSASAAALVIAVSTAAASAQVVFDSAWDNGFLTPFNSSTSSSIRYGDSGWIGTGSSAPEVVTRITLPLAVFDTITGGTTDLTFTFNDGDPSGLVFGPGTTLYSTTISNVAIPATGDNLVSFFNVVIDLPNIALSGGFNNFGWSIGVQNFSSDGQLGFTCSSGVGQFAGFYTSNAAFNNGSSWSLFSFGGDPITGVANLRAILEVPAAGTAGLFGLAAIPALRRRRSA